MSGYRNYQYLSGLAKRTILWCCICRGNFAIGGVPPFSGFPGKVLIFQGLLQMVIILV